MCRLLPNARKLAGLRNNVEKDEAPVVVKMARREYNLVIILLLVDYVDRGCSALLKNLNTAINVVLCSVETCYIIIVSICL